MAKIPFEKYEDLLRRSGLVEKDKLEAVLRELSSGENGGKPNDSGVLAKRLLDAKLITDWQNDKLMQGRHRGFFLGKYKLLRHLTKGGMSEVYLGEQIMMRRPVAIKVFPPELIEQASYLERFYQESRTQAAMDHPNIVRAHDFGNEGKIHYLVMEYVDGPDLQRLVTEKGPLGYKQVADFIRQSCEALEYAHGQGMIHRDIKPANLMLDRSGKIKLLDLGLARLVENKASLTLKYNENTLGTADYLAPEQAVDSHGVDERADIYSLGGTMYFLLTGHPPFPDGTPVQRLMMHMNQEPARKYIDRPDCPAELVEICQQMMAKKANQRYSTAAEVKAALTAYMTGKPLPEVKPAPEPAKAEKSGGSGKSGSSKSGSGKSSGKSTEDKPPKSGSSVVKAAAKVDPEPKPAAKKADPNLLRDGEPSEDEKDSVIDLPHIKIEPEPSATKAAASSTVSKGKPTAAPNPVFEVVFATIVGALAGVAAGVGVAGTSEPSKLIMAVLFGLIPGLIAGIGRAVMGK